MNRRINKNDQSEMDTISDRGFFDQNIEWETPASDEEIVATIKRFMLRAARD